MRAEDHYQEAVWAVENAERHTTEDPGDMRIAEVSAATAQARALLALVDTLRDLASINEGNPEGIVRA